MKYLMIFIVSRIVKIKELCFMQYVTAAVSSKNFLFYNDSIPGEWWIGYDLEGGGCGPVELVYLILRGRTEENHEKLQNSRYSDRD
jgi:hypothetical protein